MYSLLRPALFQLSPETAHHATLTGLNAAYSLGLSGLIAPRIPSDARTVMALLSRIQSGWRRAWIRTATASTA
jgi:dihydroorotate dehydrogenase